MDDNFNGTFSKSLFALQLQLKTLLEEAGGDSAVNLLDALSKLNQSEQRVALGVFNSVVSRILSGEERLLTEEDKAFREFEDGLYQDILAEMREAARDKPIKLEVVRGGKSGKSPIDLNKARKAKKAPARTLIQ